MYCSGFGSRKSKGVLQHDAVLLDMGHYVCNRGAGQRALSAMLTKEHSERRRRQQRGSFASGEAAEIGYIERSGNSLTQQLHSLARSRLIRVYQVLSPGHAGRAHVFGSALALNSNEWTQIDGAYFDAPGKSLAAAQNVALRWPEMQCS